MHVQPIERAKCRDETARAAVNWRSASAARADYVTENRLGAIESG
jgi:hypothetical protein